MSNRFRPTYRPLDEGEKLQLQLLQDAYATVEQLIDQLPDGRHRALAYTTLEESCMWAVKALTT